MVWSDSLIIVLGIFGSIGLIVAVKFVSDLFQSIFAYFKDKIDSYVHKKSLGEPLFGDDEVVYHINSETSMFPYTVVRSECDNKGNWIYYVHSLAQDGRESIWVCEEELSSESLFLKELLDL